MREKKAKKKERKRRRLEDVRKAKKKIIKRSDSKNRAGKIDIQEEIMVETLLDSGATGLIMSSEFARKQRFKLKRIDKLIFIRNVDKTFNKRELIENTVKLNIYH